VSHILVKRLQFGRRLNRQFSSKQFGTQFILAQGCLPLAGLCVEPDEPGMGLFPQRLVPEQGLQPADGLVAVACAGGVVGQIAPAV